MSRRYWEKVERRLEKAERAVPGGWRPRSDTGDNLDKWIRDVWRGDDASDSATAARLAAVALDAGLAISEFVPDDLPGDDKEALIAKGANQAVRDLASRLRRGDFGYVEPRYSDCGLRDYATPGAVQALLEKVGWKRDG